MKKISETLLVSYSAVRKWVRLYKTGKYKALVTKKRGHIKGVKELNEDIERKIKACIINLSPDQLDLEFNLWSRKAIQSLMEKQFGIRKSLTQIGRYLKYWGIVASIAVNRTNKSLNSELKKWIENEYPKIADLASKENAEIYWATNGEIKIPEKKKNNKSNIVISNQIEQTNQSSYFHMFAAINNRGKKKFLIIKNEPSEMNYILFLKKLYLENKKTIFIIAERNNLGQDLQTKRWINKKKDAGKSGIIIFYMPNAANLPIEKNQRVKMIKMHREIDRNNLTKLREEQEFAQC